MIKGQKYRNRYTRQVIEVLDPSTMEVQLVLSKGKGRTWKIDDRTFKRSYRVVDKDAFTPPEVWVQNILPKAVRDSYYKGKE